MTMVTIGPMPAGLSTPAQPVPDRETVRVP